MSLRKLSEHLVERSLRTCPVTADMIFIVASAFMLLIFAGAASAAGSSAQFDQQHLLPGGQIVMVAEGAKEPRSVGSYSVRLYSGVNPAFPMDDFLTGIILPRDGFVEDILIEDLDADGYPEIIITQRSAGSGSYLAADAVQYKNGLLSPLISLNGLPPQTNLISALKQKIQYP